MAETWDLAQPFQLYGAEHSYAGHAQPKRRQEFAAGRHCARAALAALGYGTQPIPRDARGAPDWPGTVVGSITHTDDYAAAAVASHYDYAGVGLDAAVIGALEARLWPLVLTRDEITWLHAQPKQHQSMYATVMFSAKEAFFKCQYAITRTWLDFKAVEIGIIGTNDLAPRYVAGPAAVKNLPPAQCAYRIAGEKVLTGVLMTQAL